MSEERADGRLDGKVAIVTGAGSSGPGYGTGKAMAVAFAREGARVLLVDHSADRAEETLQEIRREGGDASVCEADITQSDACKGMVEAAVARYGGLDILVNNVGISAMGNAVEIAEDEWDRVIEVNLKGTLLGCKHAIPAMISSGGGSVINISSIDAFRSGTVAAMIPYTASKGGIVSMTRAMAVQHGRDGVRVNCIAPGFLYTPLVAPHVDEEVRALRREASPLGTEGTAWDVAWAAVFLASDEARWITGVALPVDGGLICTTPLSMLPHLREL